MKLNKTSLEHYQIVAASEIYSKLIIMRWKASGLILTDSKPPTNFVFSAHSLSKVRLVMLNGFLDCGYCNDVQTCD